MTTTEIDKLIETWTQEERGLIHGALTSLRIGAVKLDAATNTWCMPMTRSIPAKATLAVEARGYIAMKPAKLIILEPQFEQVEIEVIVDHVIGKTEKTWWGWRTREIEPSITRERRIEHKRFVTVPRATWRVRGMFVGAESQLPTEKDIAGDLFGPEGTLALPSAIISGLDVTLLVENTTNQEMPFYAVVLGTAAREHRVALPSVETAAS
jgi:hypothetical protein